MLKSIASVRYMDSHVLAVVMIAVIVVPEMFKI
jgi:hypothetical protein